MKLWDKGFKTNDLIEQFTIGNDRIMDKYLARADIIGSLAHIKMLCSIGLLSEEEYKKMSFSLKEIYNTVNTDFEIEEGIEDIHSQIELLLTRKLGDIGKKIHSGRSRNDQVLVDLKIFFREQLEELVYLTKQLFTTLINKSERYKSVLIPGYTHFQIAMPSSFGLWFAAYAESLTDDMILIKSAYDITNQNPLGSAAGYGSSFPLNRSMTTELLGFSNLNYNSIYAQMSRGKTEKVISFALSSIASTLSKFSMDACLFMSQNFGFISLPDDFTTGSSIMPHKKNPDVFELIRAKCNKIQALPNDITLLISNLPSGYHRDMQLLKEYIFPALFECKNIIYITQIMVENIIINEKILEDKKYSYIFSVEEVNKLVLSGIPFRDAYKKVAEQIINGTFKPDAQVNHTHEGSIGNLCNDKITEKMNKIINTFPFQNVKKAIDDLLTI